jgi:hypothetical protein
LPSASSSAALISNARSLNTGSGIGSRSTSLYTNFGASPQIIFIRRRFGVTVSSESDAVIYLQLRNGFIWVTREFNFSQSARYLFAIPSIAALLIYSYLAICASRSRFCVQS